jgi:hypothetical protein
MKDIRSKLVILAALTLAGCAGGGYYASGPPPPVRVETRFGAPGPGMVWIDGYWGWNNRNYAWVPGRWVRPPRVRAVWVAPRWEQRKGRYVFRNGRWR